MANYEHALQWVLKHEGGYVNDPDDPGGETYRGIARKMHSKWDGWVMVDMLKLEQSFPANLDRNQDLQIAIAAFYEINFWDKIKGDAINNQSVATSIFDFAVNAGVSTSAMLAQMVVDAKQDGVIGPETIARINSFDPDHFISSFTLAKIARYISIVKKRPASKKYFYGWTCRALGDN